MRFVFVMDHLSACCLRQSYTTFASSSRPRRLEGISSFHCLPRDLSLVGTAVCARACPVEILASPPWITVHDNSTPYTLRLAEVDAVFVRKDPPFDQAYLYATLQLEHARGKTLIINDPRGLRDANEKLYALSFPEWIPKTLVSANRDEIHAFCREVGGDAWSSSPWMARAESEYFGFRPPTKTRVRSSTFSPTKAIAWRWSKSSSPR